MRFPDDFLEQNTNTSEYKGRTLKIRFLNVCASLNAVDKILRNRATVLVEQTGIMKYLKKNCVYLDIGTGLGHIAEQIVEQKDVKLFATEPTWKPLRKLKKRLKQKNKNVYFMKNGGERVPINSNSIDGVFLYYVLHHIPYDVQKKIINEINRILKMGGMLFLIEDIPSNSEEYERIVRWDSRLNYENANENHYYRNDDDWIEFLKKHALRVVENIYFEDISPKKDEGIIPHRCYVLERIEENG